MKVKQMSSKKNNAVNNKNKKNKSSEKTYSITESNLNEILSMIDNINIKINNLEKMMKDPCYWPVCPTVGNPPNRINTLPSPQFNWNDPIWINWNDPRWRTLTCSYSSSSSHDSKSGKTN